MNKTIDSIVNGVVQLGVINAFLVAAVVGLVVLVVYINRMQLKRIEELKKKVEEIMKDFKKCESERTDLMMRLERQERRLADALTTNKAISEAYTRLSGSNGV
jgi:uncharacterized membrane protein (DUF106 family)